MQIESTGLLVHPEHSQSKKNQDASGFLSIFRGVLRNEDSASSDHVPVSLRDSESAAIHTAFGNSSPAASSIRIESWREVANSVLKAFQATLRQRFSNQSVDTTQPIRLQSDAEGRVRVTGTHPDQAAIEQIFTDDAELADTFKYLSATFSSLNAAKRAEPFHALYAKNPQLAVAQYSHLFDDNRAEPAFGLLFADNDITVDFQ